jgi:hypothetical protein
MPRYTMSSEFSGKVFWIAILFRVFHNAQTKHAKQDACLVTNPKFTRKPLLNQFIHRPRIVPLSQGFTYE